jgi:hypothetical protein
MEDKTIPEDWGSWQQAEAWRKQSFLARTPAQRLQWLKAALILAYDSGALKYPADPQPEGEGE